MPEQITNHSRILDAIRSVKLIDQLVEKTNGHVTYELDLEVIAYGRNYTGKKVGPYVRLFVYGPGEEIIREGDWGGNAFFILVDGDLEVYIREDETNEQKKVSAIQPGRSFGEMSVLAGLPRNATIAVPADGKATVIEVDRPALRLLRKLPRFGGALEATYREYGLKRTLEDLNQASDGAFNEESLRQLERIAQFRVFGKQHTLSREHDSVDRIVFIKNGWVRRTRGTGRLPYISDIMMGLDEDVSVDFLGAGNCLGLESLRGQETWQYTATVLARTEVVEIPLALLRQDPALSQTLRQAFSRFSSLDDEVRVESLYDKRTIAAISEEIETGIVDGTNLLVMDMDLCVRCGNCSMACHKVHGQSRLLRHGIHIARPIKPKSRPIQHVLLPSVCLHCQDPECLTGCPTGAIARFAQGQIDIDPKTCIGCADCATQCPYNAISMVPRKKVAPSPLGLFGTLKSWLSLAPQTEPSAVTATEDLLAIKCNLCENTPLNPNGATKAAYSCQENCPTGALVRVNPREYFSEANNAIGIVFKDRTHAIGRNIHKRDVPARVFHAIGVLMILTIASAVLVAARRYGLNGHLSGTWLTLR